MIVEGEKDVVTATGLGVLATTNADGAGKWRVEDARTLVGLGVKKVVVCPDNDGVGFEHGVAVAKSLQGAGVEVRWLELPELGMKEDLSDWAPRQVDPKAALAELIANAPIFDEESLGWRSRLKRAGRECPLPLPWRENEYRAGAEVRRAAQGAICLERLQEPRRGRAAHAMVQRRIGGARPTLHRADTGRCATST